LARMAGSKKGGILPVRRGRDLEIRRKDLVVSLAGRRFPRDKEGIEEKGRGSETRCAGQKIGTSLKMGFKK